MTPTTKPGPAREAQRWAPWSAWPREFLRYLSAHPAWIWGPLLLLVVLLAVMIAFGPGVDTKFDYQLF